MTTSWFDCFINYHIAIYKYIFFNKYFFFKPGESVEFVLMIWLLYLIFFNKYLWFDYFVNKKPGEIEAEFKKLGTEKVLKEFLTYKTPKPLFLPKDKLFKRSESAAVALPSWLTQEDLDYYVTKYEKKGFTGAINYYRNIDRYAEYNLRFQF